MDSPRIIMIIGVVGLILIGAAFLYATFNSHDVDVAPVNNTTNVTKNVTVNSTNTTNTTTAVGNDGNSNANSNSESSSSSSSGSSQSDSESYVEKWDKAQEGGGAYTMDQPVKTDSDGNRYARVYDEDTGQSSWRSMSPGS